MKNNIKIGDILAPLVAAANETNRSTQQPGVPAAYNPRSACDFLGGISARSLRRPELRGLIKSVKVFRTKLWPKAELVRFIEEGL
jgi:hypothetical protein